MVSRSPLRSHLQEAWSTTIDNHYSKQLINSERGLQLQFCLELTSIFSERKLQRRLFIEPAVSVGSGETRFPDLVICNSLRVIGVVEFKFVPRGLPATKKDLKTLSILGSSPEVEISCDRFRGRPIKSRKYRIAADAVLCWAGVYADKSPIDFPDESLEKIRTRFLRLDAITKKDEDPEIRPTK